MNNWIFNRNIDLFLLFIPVWLCWLTAFLLPDQVIQAEAPLWIWVVFVIGIDVSHVWSTLFRTYTDPEEFYNHRTLLVLTPIICFLAAYVVSSFSFNLFWRVLAYLAVYHFVKQQYGFMRIYKAKARDFRKKIFRDDLVIYLTMLYPLLYWHINLDRDFNWFIEGDFMQVSGMPLKLLATINITGNVLYFGILAGWFAEEIIRQGSISIGKVLWVLTTAGNWFIGIVYFNSEIVFTITNVVAHGVPYLALVIFYQSKKETLQKKRKRRIPLWITIPLAVILLAFFEEYFWDMLVYRDNPEFFASIIQYPFFETKPWMQHVGLALLSVPQTTHYVLDGFIWKNNAQNPHLKPVLFG